MKFRTKEIVFLIILLLIAGISLTTLYADIYWFSEQASTQEIGIIYFKEKTAERKLASKSLWNPIQNSATVYNHDSIRTETDASAIIKLENGIDIDLGGDTLIVLNINDKAPQIQVQKGTVSANSKQNESTLQLISGKLKAFIQGGEIFLAKNENGDLTLSADAESASFNMDGEEGTLSNEQMLEVTVDGKTELKPLKYILENPSPSASYVTSHKKKNIPFQWKAQNKNSKTEKKIVISKNADFSNISYQYKSNKDNLNAELPSGLYYWKVVSNEGESPVQKFRVFQDKGAIPLLPRKNATIPYISSLPMVSFQWRDDIEESQNVVSRVEVFSDSELKNKIKSLQSYSNSIATNELPEGEYYWRVVKIYPTTSTTEAKEITGSVSNFNIQITDKMEAPKILQKEKEIIVSQKMLDNRNPVLQWQNNPNIDYYTVEIAKNEDFKEIEVSEKVKNNFYAPPKNLQEGKYFWRVKAHAGEKKTSTSETKELLVIKKGIIKNVEPTDSSSFFSKEGIYFSWYDSDKTNRYLLEFAKDNSFKEIIFSTNAKKDTIILDNLPLGNLYWRVTSLENSTEKNPKKLLQTAPTQINIKARQESLVLQIPNEQEVIDVCYTDSVFFKWEKRKDVHAYRIKVYSQIADIDNLIYEEIVSRNSFSASDLTRFREIDYLWEVSALRKSGNRYIPISEKAIGHFSIILSEKLFVPNFKTKGIMFTYEE